ncbi:type II toxin-antitoxin system RelE/ParE family toxin [Halanaerobium congolense]
MKLSIFQLPKRILMKLFHIYKQMLVIGNYLVFYVVFENKKIVEIRRILHGKRKYNFLL